MADNIQIKDGNDILTTIATEDVGGREFQLIKVGYGVSGDFNNISNINPLPVILNPQSFPNVQEVSGTLSVNVLNQTQSVSSVNILNFPSIQGVSGILSATLTNQNPVVSAVSITNFPAITSAYIINQVSGSNGTSSVSITNFPNVQGVSGTLSATLVNQNPIVSAVSITNFPAITSAYIVNQVSGSNGTSSVSITNFPNVQGISGTLSATVLNFPTITSAYIVNQVSGSNGTSSVSVTNFPTVQSVSGNISATVSNFPTTTSAYLLNQNPIVSAIFVTNTHGVSGTISATLTNQNPVVSAVSITNFPTTTSAYIVNQVSGTSSISVTNFPSVQGVSGTISATLTNQNPVVSAVSITNFPTITSAYIVNQVSGSNGTSSVSVTNFPSVQSVSGNVIGSGYLINYWPAQQTIPSDVVNVNIDPSGALQVRGAITSDEGSYSTDFTGNTIYTILSGSCIFQNGSNIVTGIDTSFLAQISYGDVIKYVSDAVLYYTRIVSVDSDTQVTLEYGYKGSTNTGIGYVAGFEQIVENDSSIIVSNSLAVMNGGLVAGSLVQLSRVVDFLPTAAVVRGFSFNQNIPQVDPFFGFFDSDDFRTSQIAAYVIFTSYQSAQLITRTSTNYYDSNIVSFMLPNNATVDIPARWRLEVTDDKVAVYYNDVLVATSYNHLPPIYKPLNFNIGVYNISTPPTQTILNVNEMLFKNVDVINTASVLQAHIQNTYDPSANALLSELTSTINSLQATLKSFASIMGMAVDINGRQRTNVETGTLTSLGTVTTVSTVTGVTTVSTLTNQSQIGAYSANDMVPSNINNSALSLRQSVSVS